MASREQLLVLGGFVTEARKYRDEVGDNNNPGLGRAILYADGFLLPWTRGLIASGFGGPPPDAENVVADADVKAVVGFADFDGTTGGQFYRWQQKIVLQLLAGVRRLSEGRNGALHVLSLERNDDAWLLAETLESPETSPEECAVRHENSLRLERAMRGLTLDQQRVVVMRCADHSLRQVAVLFDRSPSWVHDTWEAAAHQLRRKLLRGSRTPRADAVG